MPWRRVINIHILAVIIPAIARLTPVFWRFLNLYSITDRSSFLTVTCSVTVVIIITIDITYAPFTRYNRLSNRLYNRLDNRLYRVNKHPTGCQTGCQTGLTTGLTTGCIHDTAGCQAVVKPVWQPVWQQVASCKRGFTILLKGCVYI